MRQKADGERLTVLGGVPRRGERHFDYGAPVKGWSWPDRRVVEFLVAHFTSNDRIVLLTENVRWDHEGLRRILRTEVEPALLSYGIGRLGLLVLFKRGKANYDSYCSAVVRYLRVNVVCPGLTEVELPTD